MQVVNRNVRFANRTSSVPIFKVAVHALLTHHMETLGHYCVLISLTADVASHIRLHKYCFTL